MLPFPILRAEDGIAKGKYKPADMWVILPHDFRTGKQKGQKFCLSRQNKRSK